MIRDVFLISIFEVGRDVSRCFFFILRHEMIREVFIISILRRDEMTRDGSFYFEVGQLYSNGLFYFQARRDDSRWSFYIEAGRDDSRGFILF